MGRRYFVENMPFPKEKLVANLEFEMIGRPDAKVKPEELWLTGYERSNLGPELARRGAKLVQDPHPEENFFQRSDNIQLAPGRRHRPHGLELWPAHRLSPGERRGKDDRFRAHDAVDQLDGRARSVAGEFKLQADMGRGQEALDLSCDAMPEQRHRYEKVCRFTAATQRGMIRHSHEEI